MCKGVYICRHWLKPLVVCLEPGVDLDAVFEEVLGLREHILMLSEGWNPDLASEVASRLAGLGFTVYLYRGEITEEDYPAVVIDLRRGSEILAWVDISEVEAYAVYVDGSIREWEE